MRALPLIVLSLSMLVAHSPILAAEPGYRAKCSITVELGDEFYSKVCKDSDLLSSGIRVPPVNGMLYIAGDLLRVDMNLGQGHGVTTTLYNKSSGESIQLDHGGQIAWRTSGGHDPDSGAPLLNLEQLAGHWDVWHAELLQRQGIRVKQLGVRKINGQQASGLEASGDIRALVDAYQIEMLPGLPAVHDPKGRWSSRIWVSEKLGIPLKVTSSYMGMSVTWEVASIESWSVPDRFLSVPPGYRVRDMDDPATQRMLEQYAEAGV